MAHDHHHGVAPGLAAPERADHPGAAPLAARAALSAGLIPPPTSDNARWQAGEVERQVTADTPDCAGEAQRSQDLRCADNTRANLTALLAIKGYSLHELADGSYLASKWNCIKHLPSLYAVQSFARQVGAI